MQITFLRKLVPVILCVDVFLTTTQKPIWPILCQKHMTRTLMFFLYSLRINVGENYDRKSKSKLKQKGKNKHKESLYTQIKMRSIGSFR